MPLEAPISATTCSPTGLSRILIAPSVFTLLADLLVASVSQGDYFGALPGLPRAISRFFGLAAIN
jgi:hypothetical protein